MAKVALNIAKAYYNGFITDYEKSRYFQLHKNATTRADLYSFAVAKIEGKELTDIQTVNSFVRTEYMGYYEAFLSALYYEEKLKDNTDQIDESVIVTRYMLLQKNMQMPAWHIEGLE